MCGNKKKLLKPILWISLIPACFSWNEACGSELNLNIIKESLFSLASILSPKAQSKFTPSRELLMIRLEMIFCWFFTALCRFSDSRDLICYKYSMFLFLLWLLLSLSFFETLQSGKWQLEKTSSQNIFLLWLSFFSLRDQERDWKFKSSNGIKIMSNIHITRVWSAEWDFTLFVFYWMLCCFVSPATLRGWDDFEGEQRTEREEFRETSRKIAISYGEARNKAGKWENLNKTNDLN